LDHTVYHIYAKDRCLYNTLTESEFEIKWAELKAMVGLMKTDYTEDDLSYEKLPPGMGGGYTQYGKEPDGGDSY
tara:strand:+ start:105 stop:326 length:222 start_codon:yes stop_codon:yes gene_type:complete